METIIFRFQSSPVSDLADQAEAAPGVLEEALASAECEARRGRLRRNDGCRGIWGSSRNGQPLFEVGELLC